MDWSIVVKVVVSVLGFAMLAFGNSYTQSPDAKLLAHVAAVGVAVGGYLVGLFQERPQR